jgi:hypothetical protein
MSARTGVALGMEWGVAFVWRLRAGARATWRGHPARRLNSQVRQVWESQQLSDFAAKCAKKRRAKQDFSR